MLIPATRYKDCDAAIKFLTSVLGLTEHAVFRDDAGQVQHGQFTLGTGMVMIGPEGEREFGQYMVSPAEIGNRETTSVYAVLPDVRPVWDRVNKAGAEVLIALRTESYGGESFTIRDPEGHIWSFGTYDPLAPAG